MVAGRKSLGGFGLAHRLYGDRLECEGRTRAVERWNGLIRGGPKSATLRDILVAAGGGLQLFDHLRAFHALWRKVHIYDTSLSGAHENGNCLIRLHWPSDDTGLNQLIGNRSAHVQLAEEMRRVRRRSRLRPPPCVVSAALQPAHATF